MDKQWLLTGKTIVLTRAAEQMREYDDTMRALGAQCFPFPTIEIIPPKSSDLANAIADARYCDWLVFTSANGVRFFCEGLMRIHGNTELLHCVRLGVVGPATARVLQEYGAEVRCMPKEYLAEALAQEMGDVAGKKIVIAQADIARPDLCEALQQRGAIVHVYHAYRTVLRSVSREEVQRLLDARPDYITFASSSAVDGFFRAVRGSGFIPESTAFVCIGPSTAQTLAKQGIASAIVATEHTIDGMFRAILNEEVVRATL